MLKIIKENIDKEVQKLIEKQSFGIDHPEEARVKKILEEVKKHGDQAVIKYTRQFDKIRLSRKELKVTEKEIKAAYKKIKKEFLPALRKAIPNITAYHKKQTPDEWFETQQMDVVLGQRVIPLERAGIYVPGGRAAYPSSVLMSAIPAKIAGIKEIVITSPPPISPYVLVAAQEMGISSVFKVGGAQAIAALAFGTKTIPQADKIVGPGNIYVTLAKKLVSGIVGIDGLAGPSNIVIIADEDAQARFLAADLLSQAEHDPDSFAVLLTSSARLIASVKKEIERQIKKLSRKEIIKKAEIILIQTGSIKEAIAVSNQIAPEHLELEIGSPQRYLEQVKNAGAVFLGPYSPVALGDYLAGPSHVLPTGGTARFASGLSVYDFIKYQSIIGYTKPALKQAAKNIKLLAEIEGLDAHAQALAERG